MNTSCIYHCYIYIPILVYPCASTRVGSKYIPVMIISYSSVTEVHMGSLLGEALIQMSKHATSG